MPRGLQRAGTQQSVRSELRSEVDCTPLRTLRDSAHSDGRPLASLRSDLSAGSRPDTGLHRFDTPHARLDSRTELTAASSAQWRGAASIVACACLGAALFTCSLAARLRDSSAVRGWAPARGAVFWVVNAAGLAMLTPCLYYAAQVVCYLPWVLCLKALERTGLYREDDEEEEGEGDDSRALFASNATPPLSDSPALSRVSRWGSLRDGQLDSRVASPKSAGAAGGAGYGTVPPPPPPPLRTPPYPAELTTPPQPPAPGAAHPA